MFRSENSSRKRARALTENRVTNCWARDCKKNNKSGEMPRNDSRVHSRGEERRKKERMQN